MKEHWRKVRRASPPWLTPEHRRQIRKIYRSRRQGEQVDHIVPLVSPIVCGLHVPWNLEAIPAGPNMSKGNRYWPDCPHENAELFELKPEPHQLRLI